LYFMRSVLPALGVAEIASRLHYFFTVPFNLLF
jgi:hypothetical protein